MRHGANWFDKFLRVITAMMTLNRSVKESCNESQWFYDAVAYCFVSNNQCNNVFNLIVNFSLYIVPITLSIVQIIELIILAKKSKTETELKTKHKDLGLQFGTILASMINFRPNKNKMPTFGHSDFEGYHDGF